MIMENVSMFAAPDPFRSSTPSGTSCRPTLRLNTIPSFSLGGKRARSSTSDSADSRRNKQ